MTSPDMNLPPHARKRGHAGGHVRPARGRTNCAGDPRPRADRGRRRAHRARGPGLVHGRRQPCPVHPADRGRARDRDCARRRPRICLDGPLCRGWRTRAWASSPTAGAAWGRDRRRTGADHRLPVRVHRGRHPVWATGPAPVGADAHRRLRAHAARVVRDLPHRRTDPCPRHRHGLLRGHLLGCDRLHPVGPGQGRGRDLRLSRSRGAWPETGPGSDRQTRGRGQPRGAHGRGIRPRLGP